MSRSRYSQGLQRLGAERGQSLVELALFMPIFILIIAGIVEMGYFMIRYLDILDASREAARFGADLDPVGTAGPSGNPSYNPAYNHNSPAYSGATVDCGATEEFYTAVACYAQDSMSEELDPDNGYDDVVISAFTIRDGGDVCNDWRWPDRMEPPVDDEGWSYMGNQFSRFSIARVNELIPDGSPPQGLLILEMFYQHRQALGLPFFTVFVPRDIGIYVFTIMPNPTAGSLECP
ncbi:MAG TPA: TadE/TadG family type IV pilus assembly protein [Anaerolineae bacterium]|nr:TadE/TadG family type IV pilus assembly protein [Anaerolineae bacterium]